MHLAKLMLLSLLLLTTAISALDTAAAAAADLQQQLVATHAAANYSHCCCACARSAQGATCWLQLQLHSRACELHKERNGKQHGSSSSSSKALRCHGAVLYSHLLHRMITAAGCQQAVEVKEPATLLWVRMYELGANKTAFPALSVKQSNIRTNDQTCPRRAAYLRVKLFQAPISAAAGSSITQLQLLCAAAANAYDTKVQHSLCWHNCGLCHNSCRCQSDGRSMCNSA
jgi:hypothetical protein